MKYTRNEFLKLAGLCTAASITNNAAGQIMKARPSEDFALNLGLASYTFREFSLDDTIKMSLRLGLTNICLKAMHMPLESSAEEIKKIAEKVKFAGLNLSIYLVDRTTAGAIKS